MAQPCSLTPYGHIYPSRTQCGCCLSELLSSASRVLGITFTRVFIVSAEIIMSRCVALCLVLGLVAVSGASAATRQAYSPSAQALVREVVSTLKVRHAILLCLDLFMPSSLDLIRSLSSPLPPLHMEVSTWHRVLRLALSDASLLLSCPVRFRPMLSEGCLVRCVVSWGNSSTW